MECSSTKSRRRSLLHGVRKVGCLIGLLLAANNSSQAAQITAELEPIINTGLITLTGEIVPGDDARFQQALDQIAARSPSVRVVMNSPGGDIITAIKIGRLIRQRDGRTDAVGRQCLSACVLAFVGGVERSAFSWPEKGLGLGVHRFYFAEVSPKATKAEVTQRFRELRSTTAAYLTEMNVPQELLAMMESVPPARMKLLSEEEMERYSLVGMDPVWDEQQTAKYAFRHGVTSAEYRRRDAQATAQCTRKRKSWPYGNEIDYSCKDPILYGLPKPEYQRRRAVMSNVCEKYATSNEVERFSACMKAVMVEGRTSF